MSYWIKRATVIGAGTMGAGIAAHLANVGILVDLLDIVPAELTEKEKIQGLLLDHPSVRNRIAQEGISRVASAKKPGFFSSRFIDRVSVGNIEDDFSRVGQADWIIEAVVENLQVKRDLMARIEVARRPGSIVSTNTSGLPLRSIADGISKELGEHFLGTHFFNPPRHMSLLEIIPAPKTDPELLDFMVRFAEQDLGKGVVVCKDTPNFIANRVAGIQGGFDLEYVVAKGYSVEEADSILGPAIGRPKTALFRLRDLVGLDVSLHVSNNLHQAIPHDEFRQILIAPHALALRQVMVERGWLGRKTNQGFYKEVKTKLGPQFWALDLGSMDYREPRLPDLPTLEEANKIQDLAERLRFLVTQKDGVGELVWASLKNALAYAAYCLPEIAEDVVSIDNAMRWGYAWEMGPFEIWDALGMEDTVARMQDEGSKVAPWVREMVKRGHTSFYRMQDGVLLFYDLSSQRYLPSSTERRGFRLSQIKMRPDATIEESDGASLIDLGDGVACLEFHTKANTLDDDIRRMMDIYLEIVDRDFLGLLIGNEGKHFSAGANLRLLLERARDGRFEEIEAAVRRSQEQGMAFRFFHKPVVAACFGMALGGGAETVMSASRVCAAAESYIGLVEVGVGLIPSAGGCKELMRRVISPPMRVSEVDPLPFVRCVFETIMVSKVSGSAEEAKEIGFLSEADRIVMNRDLLLTQAKKMVLEMLAYGYRPPVPDKSVFALGKRGKAALDVEIFLRQRAGYLQGHGALIASKLASILCGGELSSPGWVSEHHILDLEREAFLSLCGESKTKERIMHFLETGKRLQN